MSGKDKREQDKREFRTEFSILLTSLREKRYKQRTWGKDWTQQGVANRLGVSRGMYNQWENGRAVPTRSDLKNIVSDFGLDEKEQAALFRAAAQVPPEIKHLPLRNLLFTGRERQLEQLGQLLKENNRVALIGLPGIGKTQLALEYAHSCFQKVYRVVLWVNAADETTLAQTYGELAEPLKLPEWDERELKRRIQAVKEWLEDHTNWLLIMDNADDLGLARLFFPTTDNGHILLTTRSQIIGSIAMKIEIEAMEPEEGLAFLLRRSLPVDTPLDKVSPDTREVARQVVELLCGHPLALDQAGAYIEETRVSFTDYIGRYHAERRQLLDRRGSLKGADCDYPETVVVTFELCFMKADERHPLAVAILCFCAFLPPDAIPEELFQHVVVFKFGTTVFDEAIAALHSYSLIKRNTQEKTFSVHRLVQAVLIDDMSSDLQNQLRESVLRVVYIALLKDRDNAVAIGFDVMAGSARAQGKYEEAEALSRYARKIWEQLPETKNPNTYFLLRGLVSLVLQLEDPSKTYTLSLSESIHL